MRVSLFSSDMATVIPSKRMIRLFTKGMNSLYGEFTSPIKIIRIDDKSCTCGKASVIVCANKNSSLKSPRKCALVTKSLSITRIFFIHAWLLQRMRGGSKIFCFCSKWFRLRRVFARVTKLVDVEDLKSSALIRRVGSIPTPGTKKRPKVVFYCLGVRQ